MPSVRCRSRSSSVSASFSPTLVLAEAVSATADPCGLQGEDEVFVVLPIEKRHEFAATGEGFVNLKVLLVVLHRVSDIDILHPPAHDVGYRRMVSICERSVV